MCALRPAPADCIGLPRSAERRGYAMAQPLQIAGSMPAFFIAFSWRQADMTERVSTQSATLQAIHHGR